ncbi:MAG: hypothetical protein N4A50_01885 [Vallitalea sp.]|nr:hypothetical protein [Vallitalea sp.]
MKKKIILGILIVVILTIFIFWKKYKLDIQLFVEELKLRDDNSVEKIVTVKASDLINRLSYCYNNNNSIDKINNYFDDDCNIDLLNSLYIYSEDIQPKILYNLKNRNQSNGGMLVIFPIRATSKIINSDRNQITIEVHGNLKILTNYQYFSNMLNEVEGLSYKYSVTFDKKFLFVWKASKFETKSNVIKNLLTGVINSETNK